MKISLDEALKTLTSEALAEYEEAIELWITYGGD
jgi:predicted RNase H-like HicB family nuclease